MDPLTSPDINNLDKVTAICSTGFSLGIIQGVQPLKPRGQQCPVQRILLISHVKECDR
ncbi:hypothetical protein [Marinobacterium aestuariivivens]|uniref:Uncharacterized protein n=1 Tax=Marinobacterium aestuariivivens TaxID=1698799 RepID=A0ABW2A023_9GAMM